MDVKNYASYKDCVKAIAEITLHYEYDIPFIWNSMLETVLLAYKIKVKYSTKQAISNWIDAAMMWNAELYASVAKSGHYPFPDCGDYYDFAREVGRLMMPYLASHPDIGFDSFRKSVRNMIKKGKIYCHCERLTDEHSHHQIIDAINNACKSIGSKYHEDMLIYVKLGKGQKIHMIQYKNLNLHIIVHHGVKRHNLCIAFDKDIKANPKEDEGFVYVWL